MIIEHGFYAALKRMISWPRLFLTIYALIYSAAIFTKSATPETAYLVPYAIFLLALFLAACGFWSRHEAIAALLFVSWFACVCISDHFSERAWPGAPGNAIIGASAMLLPGMWLIVKRLALGRIAKRLGMKWIALWRGHLPWWGRAPLWIGLVLVLIEVMLRALGLAPPLQAIVKVDFDGRHYWTPNMHFFADLYGADPVDKDNWEARAPLVARDKPNGVTRIVVFGESAAIGDPPDASYGFWRILEVMLKERFPQRSFEVLPMAFTGTDSYCMYEAAKAAARINPDFFVIYMGNNEVIGTSGVIAPFARLAGGHVQAIRWGKMLARVQTVRFGGIFMALAARALVPGAAFDPTNVMQRIAAYDPQGAEVHACIERYRQNLRDMCWAGRSCGARVIVCSVATNLRDWAPFYSSHGPDWTPASEAQWQRWMKEGQRLETEARYEDAAKAYRQALRLDTRYAELHFRLARCCFAMGDMSSAQEHYVQARECDRMQARAGNAINQAAKDVVREFSGAEVVLADAEMAVAEASPGGIPGWKMFYDCVHMQFPGSYQVARSVFDEICPLLETGSPRETDNRGPACSIEACGERLALTPERRLAHLDTAENGLLKSLRTFFKHDWHVAEARQQREELEKLIAGTGAADPARAYASALHLNPNDHVLQARYLRALMGRGDFQVAYDFAKQVCAEQPPYKSPLIILGTLQLQMGSREEGLATLLKAAAVYPDDTEIQEAIHRARQGPK